MHVATVAFRIEIRKLHVAISKDHHHPLTKSMRFFLYLMLGCILVTPAALSHGGHNHGSSEEMMVPGENKNGVEINLYRDKSCSCCKKWGARMVESGYQVIDHISEDINSLKTTEGITPDLAFCHTAFVDGYLIEGHVPAESIDKLLKDSPDIVGLVVPGMPLGSPGMKTTPSAIEEYDVLAIDFDGKAFVFDSYQGQIGVGKDSQDSHQY